MGWDERSRVQLLQHAAHGMRSTHGAPPPPHLDSLLGDQRVRPYDNHERNAQAEARLGGPLQPSALPGPGPNTTKIQKSKTGPKIADQR